MTDDKIKSGGEMWDERFSSDEYAYGKEANIWLSERVSQIDPPPNNRALFPARDSSYSIYNKNALSNI